MKKLLLSVLCVLCCAGAYAQADFYVGAKGGIQGNWIPRTTIDPDDEVKSNFGFYGGAFASIDITDFHSIQVELLYSRKGIRTKGTLFDNTYTRNIHYIQLPVYYSMHMSDDRCRVMLGPVFGYALGSKIKSDVGEYDPAAATGLNKFNLAFAIQGSYFVTDELGVEIKAEQGLTRTFSDASDKGTNACVMFGICYRFGY